MKQKFFKVPVANPEKIEAELNSFCDQHSVSNLDKQFVADGQNSFWAVCVTWSDNNGSLSGSSARRKNKVDYKEVLSDDDFVVFSRLRELRKTIAQREGTAAYNVFTDEQLAAIAKQRVTDKTGLAKLQGIGQTRIEKYGDEFLDCIRLALMGDKGETTTDNT